VVLGLTLSTLVISTAFNTGDTITYTVRMLVARGLGRADEVIVALPRDSRRGPAEYVGALLNGSLLTGQGGYFPQARAELLGQAVSADDQIAGLTAAIGEQVTVVNRDLQAVQGQVSLLALPPDYPRPFGLLVGADGQERGLDRLEPDQVLLNADAAAFLAAEPGSRLDLRTAQNVLAMRVADVVQTGDLGGAQATIYLALDSYQHLTGRSGLINQVLVANQGDATTSSRLSSQVSKTLRLALADRAAAAGLFERLRQESAQALVADLSRVAEGSARRKLDSLQRTLQQPELTDDFVVLASDPEVERRLLAAAGRLGAGGRGAAALPEISPLRVLEVKQLSQEQADRWGGALTSSFLLLGLFSLATGALLVLLIFVTLAAERRSELGVTRATGARRRDLIVIFLLEGTSLALVGSSLGLLLGLALAQAIVALGNASLSQYGLHLEPRLEWRSLVVAYCLGLLLTVLSVGLSAWYVSRLTVVQAIRNQPDGPGRPGPGGLPRPLVLLVLGAGAAWLGAAQRLAGLQLGGALLAIVGAALVLAVPLAVVPGVGRASQRLACSLGGLTLLTFSLAPQDWPLIALLRPPPRGLDLLFLTGLGMVFGAVWLVVYNLNGLAAPVVRLTAPLRSLGLAIRTASAYPLQHRLRTGLTLGMFALVIFAMVVGGVLLNATHRAYGDPEATAGGFDLRAELTRPTELSELPGALAGLAAARETDVVGLGRLASRPAQVIELSAGPSRWRGYGLQEIDAGFAAGLRAPLAARARGFPTDAAVWEALLGQAGLAVVVGPAAGGPGAGPAGPAFRFEQLRPGQFDFTPPQLWVHDERGGPAFALTVIGVLDPRVSFPAGLYTSARSLAATAPGPQRLTYYLKAREGIDPSALALGLGLSLGDRGMRATALGEEVRRLHQVRTLLSQLLQGFFSVGLLAGLAALGVISMRVVVERRQQIGLLRALGFRRQMVRLSFLLEASLLALLGIGLGVVLGLALARRLIDYLGSQYPELVFSIPWQQIGLIGLGAYLMALLLTIVPVWQTGRISAADALRYE
jgi:putative ABC transport system permease protein